MKNGRFYLADYTSCKIQTEEDSAIYGNEKE
jgi:hypothetical protein